jgi:glycosyltransferase involved in cell wall biosynthesis
MPKISFVLPGYNSVAWIGETIQSLLSQTVDDYEIIVINDGSTDGTREFLDDYCSHFPKVKVIHNEKNLGCGKSRNIGIEASSAPIIAMVDSDDLYADEHGAIILEHFDKNPASEMVNFPYQRIGYTNEPLEDFAGEPFNHEAFLKDGSINYFCNPNCAFKKESALAIGGYEPEVTEGEGRKTDDVQFITKWVKSGRRIDFQPGFLTLGHRVLPSSMMAKLRGFQKEWAQK